MSTNDPNAIPWGVTGVPLQPLPPHPSNFNTSILPQGSNIGINNTSSIIDKNVIRGSEIYVEQKVSMYEVSGNQGLNTIVEFRDKIKENLMKQMIEYMLNNNYIEFTSQENMADQQMIYRARAYLVPDDQVRVLRTTGSIK